MSDIFRLRNLSTVLKITIASTLVVGVVMVLIAIGAYYFARMSLFSGIDARLSSHSEKVETELEEYLGGLKSTSSPLKIMRREEIGDLSTDGLQDLHVWVWNSAGQTVITDTITSFEPLSPTHNRNTFILKQLHHDTVCTVALDAAVFQAATYRLCQKTYRLGESGTYTVVLTVAVMASLQETEQELMRFRGLLVVIVLVVPFITGLAAYYAARTALHPITTMTDAAARMSVGNLRERLRLPEAKDEVRSLAETFNSMLARLQTSFEAQQHFVADAAHELRTPLTALRCELELVLQTALDAGSVPQTSIFPKIEYSLKEISRLERLTEHLLTLARLDAALPLHVELVRVDEVVIECVQRIMPLATQKFITVDFFIEEALEMNADILYLRRALVNLAENAVVYAPEHTTVSMQLHRSRRQFAESRAEEEIALLVITNAGEIAVEDRERIFERFYRGERERSKANGSGLGLAIAREIIIRQGGVLSLETQHQTVVCTVMLPLQKIPT
ncbi:MAG: HAMP domain-containing protein [Ignavibacteria bacterium]|nr:HAMP domain-containing protein [Ignavibacteria bacterium]